MQTLFKNLKTRNNAKKNMQTLDLKVWYFLQKAKIASKLTATGLYFWQRDQKTP